MKVDVVFIDQNGDFRRVIMKGINGRANMYLWRHLPTPPSERDIDINDYVSMRKFLRENYQNLTADYKTRLFSSIALHTKPKNTYTVWCHKDSKI
jgi:hypothetical protein